jgi:hypothetical protein
MNENESLAHAFTADEFLFQVKEWKDGIVFVNYAGGYKKSPRGYPSEFFGNTIAMIRDGKITMKEYNKNVIKARRIMNAVAEKFGMGVVEA